VNLSVNFETIILQVRVLEQLLERVPVQHRELVPVQELQLEEHLQVLVLRLFCSLRLKKKQQTE
jgi:hypothetical protein